MAIGALLFAVILTICFVTVYMVSVNTEAEPSDGIYVPIIMYHSILKDPNRAGKFVVSPDTLEKDMVYLKENGFTTVTVTDLINYVYKDAELPEKPVIITFDDGYYNNLTYALPLMEKYDMCCVISVVGTYADTFTKSNDLNPNYAYLTWDNIKELSQSGHVEIQNHTYNMHNNSSRKGIEKKKGESMEVYTKILTDDLIKMQNTLKSLSNVESNAFTYPFGAISKESLEIVKELGFKASLSCYEKPNYITKDTDCLYSLNRYNRPSGIDTERFMKKILNL